jgi:hypothetical protein
VNEIKPQLKMTLDNSSSTECFVQNLEITCKMLEHQTPFFYNFHNDDELRIMRLWNMEGYT